MIRTLIEISCDDEHDHKRQLHAALDKIGFEPKDTPEHTRFMMDLYDELEARGLKAWDLVSERRAKRESAA